MGDEPALEVVAVNVVNVLAHIVSLGLTEIFTTGVNMGFTFMVMLLLVSVADVTHVSLLVSTQLTTSPSASVEVIYLELSPPTFAPLSFHWKDGVDPPLANVAVNVTVVPAHIVSSGLSEIATIGVNNGFTVIVIVSLFAVVGLAAGSLLVITTHTMSPLERDVVENVLLFAPALLPFTFHW